MTYYSPGVEYLCPRCKSNWVRFIFDNDFRNNWQVKELIHAKKVNLSNSINNYYKNNNAPKWMFYECYDCGIVLF